VVLYRLLKKLVLAGGNMKNLTTSFMRGFTGSFILAFALVSAVYSTVVSFVKQANIFDHKQSEKH